MNNNEIKEMVEHIVEKAVAEAMKDLSINTTVNVSVPAEKAQEPVKAKNKLDWSKIPVDTLVEVREFHSEEWAVRAYNGKPSTTFIVGKIKATNDCGENFSTWDNMRLAPKEIQPWIVWIPTEDSVCPLPEGVMVEVIFREGVSEVIDATDCVWNTRQIAYYQIIAYKIIGLAEGWEY